MDGYQEVCNKNSIIIYDLPFIHFIVAPGSQETYVAASRHYVSHYRVSTESLHTCPGHRDEKSSRDLGLRLPRARGKCTASHDQQTELVPLHRSSMQNSS